MGWGERKYTQVLTFHDDVYYHIGRRRSISNVDKIQGKFYLYVTWQSEWEKIVSDFKMAIEKKQVEHYFSSIFANFFGIVHIWLFTIRVEPAEETMKFWEIIKFGKNSFFKYRQQIIFFFNFYRSLSAQCLSSSKRYYCRCIGPKIVALLHPKSSFCCVLYNCSTKLPFKFSRSFIDEIIHHKNFFIWPSAAKCKPKPKCVYFNFFTFISSDFLKIELLFLF